jgi:arginyl-tRNA synthetase
VITAELRRAIREATGAEDPLLRPGPAPGRYVTAAPFRLAPDPRTAAVRLARQLLEQPSWIANAEVTGPGFVTVSVTHAALARLAIRVAQAGPACAASDALAGRTVAAPTEPPFAVPPSAEPPFPEPPPAEPPPAASSWPQARAALAARVTVRLAATAGARILGTERGGLPAPLPPARGPVADAIDFAGADAVRFALARMPPGGAPPDPAVIARHVLANPAYAVRYAHAAAAAVLRWAAALGIRPAGFTPRLLAEPGELALLDALSWLPERVAVAARRGRPDEFAGWLAELAARTIDTMSTTRFTKIADIGSERLWLADAARTGLAAGLGLLGIGAPDRL